jgi:hypothetical protein
MVLIFLMLILGLGIVNMQKIHDRAEHIVKFNDEEIRLAQTMYLTVTERALALRNLILLEEEKEIQIEVERIAAQNKKYFQAQEKLEALVKKDPESTDAELTMLKAISEQAKLSEPFIAKGWNSRCKKRKPISISATTIVRFRKMVGINFAIYSGGGKAESAGCGSCGARISDSEIFVADARWVGIGGRRCRILADCEKSARSARRRTKLRSQNCGAYCRR